MPTSVIEALRAEFPDSLLEYHIRKKTRDNSRGLQVPSIPVSAILDRLDAAVGPENWSDSYVVSGETVICTLSIRCDAEWVSKSDAGVFSANKKNATADAFKKAAARWGIGRYLQQRPEHWVSLDANGQPAPTPSTTDEGQPATIATGNVTLTPVAPAPTPVDPQPTDPQVEPVAADTKSIATPAPEPEPKAEPAVDPVFAEFITLSAEDRTQILHLVVRGLITSNNTEDAKNRAKSWLQSGPAAKKISPEGIKFCLAHIDAITTLKKD